MSLLNYCKSRVCVKTLDLLFSSGNIKLECFSKYNEILVLFMEEIINKKPKYPIKTLLNMSQVLDCFINENKPMKLSDLEEKLDLYPSTIHRILDTLRFLDFIDHLDNSEYQLGIKCLELGMSKLSQIELIKEASPFLGRLAMESNENVYLGVLFDGFVIFQAKKEVQRAVKIDTHIGTRAYAHSTSLGKILLSSLCKDERDKIYKKIGFPKLAKNTITDQDLFEKEIIKVKQEGFATDDEENEDDIRCVAAPIRNHTGNVIAALSISGPSYRFDLEKQNLLIEKVIEYSKIISQKMGYTLNT